MLGPGILTSSPFCWAGPSGWYHSALVTCSLLHCQWSCPAFLTQVGRTFHTPVAMTTDWEEPSRSYCCQGRICQSKKLAGERSGKGGANQNHQQGWSVGGRSWWGGENFWLVAKHQGIEKEHFSAMYIQMNVLKSPLNILWAAMPYLLGEVICWRYKLFCDCQSGARDHVSWGQDMPSKIQNHPGSGMLHKCQERFSLQLRYRYVSLARYPRTCRKGHPQVFFQLFEG